MVGVLAILLVTSACDTDVPAGVPPLWRHGPDGWLTVLVTGNQFNWHITYPGADGILRTADDIQAIRHLHLPLDTRVRLSLTSEDYLYSLALPDWNLKEIAVPDLSFSLEFETDQIGRFELRGDQLCGFSHPNLMATVTVETSSDFNIWLHRTKNTQR